MTQQSRGFQDLACTRCPPNSPGTAQHVPWPVPFPPSPTRLMRSLAPLERAGSAGNRRSTRRMRLYVSECPAASKGGWPYRNS